MGGCCFSSFLFRATTNNFFFLRTTIQSTSSSSGQWEIFSYYFLSLVDVNINPQLLSRQLQSEPRESIELYPSIHPTHWQKTTSSLYMPSPFVCLSVVCSQHATNFALLFSTPETLVCFHLDGVRDRPNSFETKRNCVFFFPPS